MARDLTQNKLKLFASPWSAPGWMKQTGKMIGGGTMIGAVNGPYYQTWANYFVRYTFFEKSKKFLDFLDFSKNTQKITLLSGVLLWKMSQHKQ
jgi:glucosylceramidase